MTNDEILTALEMLYNAVSHLITINERLRDEVTALKDGNHKNNGWLSVEQLINYLPNHPSVRTLYDWVRYDRIPHHKLLGSLIFNREEIDKWILNEAKKL